MRLFSSLSLSGAGFLLEPVASLSEERVSHFAVRKRERESSLVPLLCPVAVRASVWFYHLPLDSSSKSSNRLSSRRSAVRVPRRSIRRREASASEKEKEEVAKGTERERKRKKESGSSACSVQLIGIPGPVEPVGWNAVCLLFTSIPHTFSILQQPLLDLTSYFSSLSPSQLKHLTEFLFFLFLLLIHHLNSSPFVLSPSSSFESSSCIIESHESPLKL